MNNIYEENIPEEAVSDAPEWAISEEERLISLIKNCNEEQRFAIRKAYRLGTIHGLKEALKIYKK